MREDFQQFRQKALQEALAYPGLTKEEYSVMCALVQDDSGTPDEVARYCLLYCPDKNAAPYLAAVDTLIEKGYVRVLDEATISAMRAEIQRTNPLFLDYLMPSNCYYPGNVDLTTESYFVFRDISAKLNGGLHTELGESLCIDDDQGTIWIYAHINFWAMDARIGGAVRSLVSEGKQIVKVYSPERVAEWYPNRFVNFLNGWCVRIEYTPFDIEAE